MTRTPAGLATGGVRASAARVVNSPTGPGLRRVVAGDPLRWRRRCRTRRRPGRHHPLRRGFRHRRRRPTGGRGDDHRDLPRRPARTLPLLGRRQSQRRPRAAGAEDRIDLPRREKRSLPDALGRRSQISRRTDRRSRPPAEIRTPRLRDPVLHRRRPRSRNHHQTGFGLLLERDRPRVEQRDQNRRHLGRPTRPRCRRAVLRRLRRGRTVQGADG
nr:hypothetical protein CPGR_03084 [Mycolicibacterium malmesburyense]